MDKLLETHPNLTSKQLEFIRKQSPRDASEPIVEPMSPANGVNGQIELYESFVSIKRKGFLSFLTQDLKGDKDIFLKSIGSVQLKDAGHPTNGFFEFTFVGGRESKAGLCRSTPDENTVMSNKSQQWAFEAISQAVYQKLS